MKMVLRQFANCLDVTFKLLFRGGKSLVIMMMFPIAGASPSPSMSGDAAGAGGDANPDAAAVADPSALAAVKPELPDDLSYCLSGMKDEMLDGGGFKYRRLPLQRLAHREGVNHPRLHGGRPLHRRRLPRAPFQEHEQPRQGVSGIGMVRSRSAYRSRSG